MTARSARLLAALLSAAVFVAGCSAQSCAVILSTHDFNLQAVPTDSSTLRVDWVSNSCVNSYDVGLRDLNATAPIVYKAVAPPALSTSPASATTQPMSQTFSSLAVGHTYAVVLQAYLAASGESDQADARVSQVVAMPPACLGSVPTAPTSLKVKGSPGSTSLQLKWAVPSGNPCVASYRIQAFDTTANPDPNASPVLSTTTPANSKDVSYDLKITNLVPAHSYDILVQPMYSRTTSSGKKEMAAGPGATVSATTGANTPDPVPTPVPIIITCSSPPGPVQALSGVATSSSTVQLSWVAPNLAPGCSLSYYKVDVIFVSGGSGVRSAAPVSWQAEAVTITVPNLIPGATYQFVVTPVAPQGNGPSSSVQVQLPQAGCNGPPGPVNNLIGFANSPTSATISWTAPTSGCPFDYYLVSRTIVGGIMPMSTGPTTFQRNSVSITFNDLSPGVTYQYTVQAVSQSNGNSAGLSTTVSQPGGIPVPTPTPVPTPGPCTPGPIGGISSRVSGNIVTVSWMPPSGWCTVTGYAVTVTDITASTNGMIGLPQPQTFTTSMPSFTTTIQPGHTYQISVAAMSGASVGPSTTTTVSAGGGGGGIIIGTNNPTTLPGTISTQQTSQTWSNGGTTTTSTFDPWTGVSSTTSVTRTSTVAPQSQTTQVGVSTGRSRPLILGKTIKAPPPPGAVKKTQAPQTKTAGNKTTTHAATVTKKGLPSKASPTTTATKHLASPKVAPTKSSTPSTKSFKLAPPPPTKSNVHASPKVATSTSSTNPKPTSGTTTKTTGMTGGTTTKTTGMTGSTTTKKTAGASPSPSLKTSG